MAFCIKCGCKLTDGANFCANCGNSVNGGNESVRSFVYEGKVHKCPNCGETLDAFISNCPTCGFELRGKNATNSVRELALKLEQIESTREPVKHQNIFQKAYSANNLTRTDEQKINLIRNYAIPNTREDLLEFIILADSNVDEKMYNYINSSTPGDARKEIADAWRAKYEQAYQKAKIMLVNDPEMLRIEELYTKKQKRIRKQKMVLPMLIVGPFLVTVLLVVILMVLPEPSLEKKIERRQTHLEHIESQIEDDIAEGRYEDAKNKAYTLTFNEELSEEKAEYWENRQEELLKIIDEASGETK